MRTILIAAALFLANSAPTHAQGAGGNQSKKVTVKCSDGNSKAEVDGETITVNCGANTPSKCGTLPPMKPCIGTSYRCMKGKECIEIEGAYKFHKTNCGSGGKEATGNLSTAGCVVMDDEGWAKLESLAGKGTEYCVQGPGGGGSGR
jgi:hypothetical protein